MTAKTSQKLADALRAAGFTAMAEAAEADQFHDFLSPLALPDVELDRLLYGIASDTARSERERLAAHHLRMRHHNGEFDASKEESDEWAASEDGQEAHRQLFNELKGRP